MLQVVKYTIAVLLITGSLVVESSLHENAPKVSLHSNFLVNHYNSIKWSKNFRYRITPFWGLL